MTRRASCRRGRVCGGLRLRLRAVLQNKTRGYTYSWLRPEWWLLGRRTEISRTLHFYACFFGRGRCDSLAYSLSVSVSVLIKYFNFMGGFRPLRRSYARIVAWGFRPLRRSYARIVAWGFRPLRRSYARIVAWGFRRKI